MIVASLALIGAVVFGVLKLVGEPPAIRDETAGTGEERVADAPSYDVDRGPNGAAPRGAGGAEPARTTDPVEEVPASAPEAGVEPLEGEGIVGVLVDPEGNPVARANVMAFREMESLAEGLGEVGDRLRTLRVGGGGQMTFGATKRTITDRQGRFAIRDIQREGTYRVELNHPSHPRHEVAGVEWTSGSRVDLGQVRLPQPARIRGYVKGPDGRPVEGAMVSRREAVVEDAGGGSPAAPRVRQFSLLVAGLEGGGDMIALGGSGARSEPTDVEGYFEMSNVAPGLYDIVARKPGLAEGVRARVLVSEGENAGPITIALEPGREISGVVVDADGNAVENAFVSASSESGSSESVRSGPDGAFTLTGLGAGGWSLTAFVPGTASTGHVRDVAAGTKNVRIEVARPLGLAGRVVDGRGEPVDGVTLQLKRRSGSSDAQQRSMVSTFNGGQFRFYHTLDGTYEIEVHKKGFRQTTHGPYELAGRSIDDIEIIATRE